MKTVSSTRDEEKVLCHTERSRSIPFYKDSSGSLQKGRGKIAKPENCNNLLTYLPTNLLTSRKAAYTLAEVLVTLGIIGIVAAIIMPGLMGKWKEKVRETQAMKSTSQANNSLKQMIADNGDCTSMYCTTFDAVMFSGSGTAEYSCESGLCNINIASPEVTREIVAKYFNAVPDENIDYLSGYVNNASYSNEDEFKSTMQNAIGLVLLGAYKLPNGVYLLLGYLPDTALPVISIDINGGNPPNKYGTDMFCYGYTESGDIVNIADIKYMHVLSQHDYIEVEDENIMSEILEEVFPDAVKSGKVFLNSLTK